MLDELLGFILELDVFLNVMNIVTMVKEVHTWIALIWPTLHPPCIGNCCFISINIYVLEVFNGA